VPTSSAAFVRKWGTYGSGDGQFYHPGGVAVASDGSVYVADTNRIQKFTSEAVFVSKWGTRGKAGSGWFARLSKTVQFDMPNGVAVASDGSVYVSEWVNNRIQKFTSEGVFVSKWGTKGKGDGQFEGPSHLAVGPEGSVYVVDSANHRIQKFSVVQ
jgi:DNA-binding beta-propeller fold protein YncE